MIPDWQDIAAWGLVALALGYVLRMAYRSMSSQGAGSGCGSGCGSCPSAAGPNAGKKERGEPLVSIGPPRIRSDHSA